MVSTQHFSQLPKVAWQFLDEILKATIMLPNIPRTLLIRTLQTTLLQIFCKMILNSQVIVKNSIDPDDNQHEFIISLLQSIKHTYIHCVKIMKHDSTAAIYLTLPMLWLLSSKLQGCKDFWKSSKPCHVGIHWIALNEYPRMRTHVPGFQSFSEFFHHLGLAKLATSSIRVKLKLTHLHSKRPKEAW